MEETLSGAEDCLLIDHLDGQKQKVRIPAVMPHPLRLGRETDNDIVLNDPRVSRYHAQLRRSASGLEIIDLGSANGVLVGGVRIPVNVWHLIPAAVVVYLGDTGITYEPSTTSATTVSMQPVSPQPAARAAAPRQPGSMWRWLLAGGVLVVVVMVVIVATGRFPANQGRVETATPVPAVVAGASPTPSAVWALTPAQEVPRVPYPVAHLEGIQVMPIVLGGLPDPTQAFIVVQVRVENLGTGDFTVSSQQFELLDDSGAVMTEAGGGYSDAGLRKLGLTNRFQNLRLGPGDSVAESLLFAGKAQSFRLRLRFEPPGLEVMMLDLGNLDAGEQIARALGTPARPAETAAAGTPTQGAVAYNPPPVDVTARPSSLPVPKMVPAASLTGTIAYPVFNGTTYDMYLHTLGESSRLFRTAASQPQFSPDGKRIAYHSWQAGRRGLVAADVDGGAEHVVAGNLEDQLPTWSPDGSQIIFLSRRSGQRASELFQVTGAGGEAHRIGNGEYPTWAANGQLAFKGWESTGTGLRLAQPDLTDLTALTDDGNDTAPALSPDGTLAVFMSRRDGNWNIYVVHSDGSGLKRLTSDPAGDGLPTWSPDGRAIAFVSNRGGPWAVWAITPEGSGSRQLFTMEGSPDGFVTGEDLDKSRGWAEERISWTR